MTFEEWLGDFTAEIDRRAARGEPDWAAGARMHPAIVRSVQRFQLGEAGDGANLIAKSGGGAYGDAVKLFIDEERNHARMLAELLGAAQASTITGHWSDAVFVRLRRALGLRMELMVLSIAEVVALAYYRSLRDGTTDPLTTEVAGRLLADERRHVPFHRDRLRAFGSLPWLARHLWHLMFLGAVLVVALDHGSALKVLGRTRWSFIREARVEFAVASDLRGAPGPGERAAPTAILSR
ncbi:hypothetical protein [Actinokineospora enzanensis]|uniref:hypothetical protein n=1 Tax=Actinokineospora enzanensis TaxID=155975 RepID=UPI0003661038|nr:hypothetical protein [Actinokineospora enzanensis]